MMEEFEEKLLDIFEVDTLNDDDIMEDMEAWDSLAIISIIALAGSIFNKQLSVAEIKNAKTIGNLKKLVNN